MIVSRFYEDLSVLHDNTLPARAYYIPASEKMNILSSIEKNLTGFSFLMATGNLSISIVFMI